MDDFHCLRCLPFLREGLSLFPSFSVSSRKLRKWICQQEQCSILRNTHVGRLSRECYLGAESHLGLFKFKSSIGVEHSWAINLFVAFMLGWSQRKCDTGNIWLWTYTFVNGSFCLPKDDSPSSTLLSGWFILEVSKLNVLLCGDLRLPANNFVVST